MAKKQSAGVNAGALACTSALVAVYTHVEMVAEAATLERLTSNGAARDAIMTMRGAFGDDVSGYLAAVVVVFGTKGVHHSKPDYVAGTLRAGLLAAFEGDDADKAEALKRVAFATGQARTVANWIADPVRLKDAEGKALFTLYKEALKGSGKAKTPRTKAEAPEAPSPAQVSTLAQMVATFGIGAVLGECSRVLATVKSTKTQAATLAAIAVQVAA